MKGSKNCPTNKKESQKINLKLSSECELCIDKTGGCEKGKKYCYSVSVLHKSGNGVVCER